MATPASPARIMRNVARRTDASNCLGSSQGSAFGVEMNDSCPSEEQLAGFVAGRCPGVEASQIRDHLATCRRCAQWVAEARSNEALLPGVEDALRESSGPAALCSGMPGSDCTTETAPPPDPLRGRSGEMAIAGYEILSEVHRGGQGVVYKAIQKATKRTVAVKVLLEGPYASPRQRHRFEREVDLAASLQHPNIVTVFDSGVTAKGLHYFAMEYIHGRSLAGYLSEKALTVREKLHLFAKIATAVSFAHQRGVIHRDLKPGNIQVDATGEPHILDFGLAKAPGLDLAADGLPVTVTGEFLGTLAYSSPEQTRGVPGQIDVRSDVYSLGVILYEMLTDHYPYPVVGQLADVLRNIAEAEPEPPSSWYRNISRTSGRRAAAAYRLDSELETIVLKALAKDKERRYQSADHFGQDIGHYLAGEPIEAKRDSAWYVIRKLAARHAYATTAMVALLVSMVSFASISFYYYRDAQEALRQQQLSDRETVVTTQQLDRLSNVARRMSLGWFLLEWHGGRVARAREILNRCPASSPERVAMMFLLDPEYTASRLQSELPAESAALAHFVVGERHLMAGRIDEASVAFRATLSAESDDHWLASAARSRLDQLSAQTAIAGPAGRSE